MLLAMLNCRDPLFGGGSNPNTLAGAARLGEPATVFSLIKSKFSFGAGEGRSRGSVSWNSRDQFASLDRAYGAGVGGGGGASVGGGGEKYGKSGRSADVEAGRRASQAIQFPRRGSGDRDSTYSLTSFDRRSRLSSHHQYQYQHQHGIDEMGLMESPVTADMKTTSELLPPSPGGIARAGDRDGEYAFERRNELPVRNVVILTPPPAVARRTSQETDAR